jgi:hypothetical protein
VIPSPDVPADGMSGVSNSAAIITIEMRCLTLIAIN